MVDSNHIRFVHYTRAEAAMKILKSKQVWMRKSMCMNDYMEVLHGIRYLEDIFTSKLGDRFKFVLNGLFPDLALKMPTMFVNSKLKLLTDTYITCVSEHNSGPEDVYGRLSMWRAYGGNSGVALVMQTMRLSWRWNPPTRSPYRLVLSPMLVRMDLRKLSSKSLATSRMMLNFSGRRKAEKDRRKPFSKR